ASTCLTLERICYILIFDILKDCFQKIISRRDKIVTAEMTYSETQKKILTSALNLIAENGFKATTTKQIAKTANINESTVFKNFDNKMKLFLAIQKNEMSSIQAKFAMIFQDIYDNPTTFLIHAIDYTYQVFLEHSAYITIMLRELDNETINVGENSIFEYVTNMIPLYLSKMNNVV